MAESFHLTPREQALAYCGDNLPNENAVHEKYGSKSFMVTGSSHALDHATGFGPLQEFAASQEESGCFSKQASLTAVAVMVLVHFGGKRVAVIVGS